MRTRLPEVIKNKVGVYSHWMGLIISVFLFLGVVNGCGGKKSSDVWIQPDFWYFTDKTMRLDEMVRMPEKSSKGEVRFIWVDQRNPDIIYAGTDGGLFKSSNRGNEWFPINNGLTNFGVLSLVQDPANPMHLFVGVRKSMEGFGGVYESTTGGKTWRFMENGPKEFSINSLLIDSETLYAGTYGGGLYVSKDKGGHWQSTSKGFDVFGVYSIQKEPHPPYHIFAGTEKGLFELNNTKGEWKRYLLGGGSSAVISIAFDPATPGKIYIGTEGRGFFFSEDRGAQWRQVEKFEKSEIPSILVMPSDENGFQPSIVYAAMGSLIVQSRDGGNSWDEIRPNPEFSYPPLVGENISKVRSMAFLPGKSGVLYTGWDQGRGIVGIRFNPFLDATWASLNNGLVNSSAMDLLVSKHDSSVVFGATWGSGLVISENRGQIWKQMNDGFNGSVALSIAEHPQNPMILYAGGEDGVYKSWDRGVHWKRVGSPIRKPIDILIDPKNPAKVYVASWGDGFFKSENGGEDWVDLSHGLEVRRAYSIAIDPMQTDILYLGTDYDLYKSTDGGKNWKQLHVRPVQVVILDPTDPSTVYAGTCKWIYKSTDGGKTWSIKRTGMKYTDVYSLAIDPERPNVIYAGTYEGGMYKSMDGAESWAHMSVGLSNKHIYSLAMDIRNPEVLYAGTFSATFASGVFKTRNGGDQWNLTHPGESELTNPKWVAQKAFSVGASQGSSPWPNEWGQQEVIQSAESTQ